MSNSFTSPDAIGSVAFHPVQPVLLSVSGSRHFPDVPCSFDSSDSSPEGDDDRSVSSGTITNAIFRSRVRPYPVTRDASIHLWRFNGPVGKAIQEG